MIPAVRLAALLTVLGLVATGCFDDPPPPTSGTQTSTGPAMTPGCDPGSLGCTCFPNATCSFDLMCMAGLCAPAEGTSSSTATASTGLDPSTGAPTTTAVDSTSSGGSSGESTGAPSGHILFTTSTSYTGAEVGGLDGADALCTTLGQGLRAGPWVAVLSDVITPVATRITVTGDVVNTQGELLASTEAELLSGRLLALPGYDENGDEVDGSTLAWTGSSTDDCIGWTVDAVDVFGAAGLPSTTDSLWLDTLTPLACSAAPRLYCLSQ